jgi:hypothetical protein
MRLPVFLFLSGMIFSTYSVFAKDPGWSGEKKYTLLQEWSFGLNGGFTSYYGDLSLHDRNYFNKILFESKPAVGLIVTKHINNTYGIASQVIYGGFRSNFSPELSFKTRFLEYNLQGRVDVFELFVPDNPFRLKGIAFAGFGQFVFEVIQTNKIEGNINENIHSTGVPEFVLFFGGGLSYEINYKLRITAEMALRQAQNDKLDNFISGKDFDYYTYLSFGISYYVPSFVKQGNVMNLIRNDSGYKWR